MGTNPFADDLPYAPVTVTVSTTGGNRCRYRAVAIPEMLYCCEVKNGVDKRVARFAVPFSVTLSANGSAVFIVTSAIFIAQYIGFDLSTSDVIVIT